MPERRLSRLYFWNSIAFLTGKEGKQLHRVGVVDKNRYAIATDGKNCYQSKHALPKRIRPFAEG